MTYQQLKTALAAINDHTDKYPVPSGENPDQFFQAEEFNLFKETLEYLIAHSPPAFPTVGDFPITGKTGVLYITEDTDQVYIWNQEGGNYIQFGRGDGGTNADLSNYFTKSETTQNFAAINHTHPYLQSQIDAINLILQSDDINLDTLQELADRIKSIGANPDNITIPDVQGLVAALSDKLDTDLSNADSNLNPQDQQDFREKIGILEVETSQATTIHFRSEVDYGTINNPINMLTFDFTDAKRDVIQTVYYNGQNLPSGVEWLNGSSSIFQANTTFYLVLKWDGGTRVIGNLITI